MIPICMQLYSVEHMLNTSLTFFSSKLDSPVIKTLERIRFFSNENIGEWESNFDEKMSKKCSTHWNYLFQIWYFSEKSELYMVRIGVNRLFVYLLHYLISFLLSRSDYLRKVFRFKFEVSSFPEFYFLFSRLFVLKLSHISVFSLWNWENWALL